MKKNVIKTAIAAVCVVAAGMGGMKAYNVATQSQADLLLAENIDALSDGDSGGSGNSGVQIPCVPTGNVNDTCTFTVIDASGNSKDVTTPGYVHV